jgi:hypothetical protein
VKTRAGYERAGVVSPEEVFPLVPPRDVRRDDPSRSLSSLGAGSG